MDNKIQVVLEGMDAVKKAFDTFVANEDIDCFSPDLMSAYEGLMEEMGKTIARIVIEQR